MARLEQFWQRFRVEAGKAWADTNRAHALMAQRRQVGRPNDTMRWVNTARGPRLMGAVLPTER